MLPEEFVHLHVHSEYSLLDGAIRVKKLIKEVVARGGKAIALTDHDAMHGMLEFYLEAQANKINPILGYEANVPFLTPNTSQKPAHLVLLAENDTGYKNLIKVCSFANTEGKNLFGEETQGVSWEFLRAHSEGLICLTSCAKGELAILVSAGRDVEARSFVSELKNVFGVNSVFVEIIDNNLPEQKLLVPKLAAFAKSIETPLVATADVHYLHKKDKETHLSLLAIKHKLNRDQTRGISTDYDYHLSTFEEMQKKFAAYPEALENTKVIADRCKVKIDTKNFFMPDFRMRPEEPADEGLARISREGLEGRRPAIQAAYGDKFTDALWKEYKDRLEYELDVINKMKFAGYFLIVQDFINWAKNQGIPVGPGRGSAAGSLVTYAIRITDIDPIRFNLLFERFLNPERISMPDIDTDFCQDRRGEVLDYVYSKYGARSVCQIVTFGRMMAKNAIKNLARITGWAFHESNDFAKLIPEGAGMTLEKAVAEEAKLKERLAADERAKELWDGAIQIEGILNSLGIHAAGVVISDSAIDERCPIMESEGQLLTQLEYKYAEKIGLIKFDFLGLKTLTVIERAVKLVHERIDKTFDISTIDLYDPKVYEMLQTAHVTGVFQLESNGMRKLVADMQPDRFEDIFAINALFRPGPLGSGLVEDFVKRKHGRAPVEYIVPEVEPILNETYGVIVYQEQVLKVAATLASYSLGEADLLRRAMGKKDRDEMARQKVRFVEGAVKNGHDAKKMEDLFDLLAKFAEYGFNKSHSVAYGLVTYQTAYLKTYFPTEFMTAIMSCDLGDTDKVVSYVRDCKRLKIKLLPPSVNASHYEFTIPADNTIQFGLGAINGIGKGIIDLIVEERKARGKFKSVPEFIARLDARKLNKKILESLIKGGAFDDISKNRAELLANSDSWLRAISREQETAESSSSSIFDIDVGNDIEHLLVSVQTKPTPPWPLWTTLEHEFNSLGFYMTGHPTDLIRQDLDELAQTSLDQVPLHLEPDDVPDFKRKSVKIAGMVTAVFDKRTKENEPFCVLKLEDGTGELEVAIFPKQYAALTRKFSVGENVWVECKVRRGIEEGSVKAVCQAIGRLSDKRAELTKRIILETDEAFLASEKNVQTLRQILQANQGKTPVLLEINLAREKIKVQARFDKHPVFPSDDFLQTIEKTWPGRVHVKRNYRAIAAHV